MFDGIDLRWCNANQVIAHLYRSSLPNTLRNSQTPLLGQRVKVTCDAVTRVYHHLHEQYTRFVYFSRVFLSFECLFRQTQ